MDHKETDLFEFCRSVKANAKVCSVLTSVDPGLCANYGEVMIILFKEIVNQEHKDKEEFAALKDAYAAVARAAMRYLDRRGVTAAVASVVGGLADVSFARNADALLFDTMLLNRMGVPFEKIVPFWAFVDSHKEEVIARMRKPGFTLESLVGPSVSGFGTETDGEAWEHLSPGRWRKLAGACLIIVNCLAATPTAGVAAASILAGAAGVVVT